MVNTVILGLCIPFIGTTAGAACVFFLRRDLKRSVQRLLNGFAAGVMVAASIWSLIVPAIEQSADKGRFAFLPAFTGFWIGIAFSLMAPIRTRLSAAFFGAFCLVLLALRQQGFVVRNKNPSKHSR